MSPYVVALTAVFAALLGFLAGLVSYRVSRRWCPTCGSSLSCLTCPTGSQSPQPRSGR